MSRDTGVRARLERLMRAAPPCGRFAKRSRIVLYALAGLSTEEIAGLVGVSRHTVTLWIDRFTRGGADALLHDAGGRGRHASIDRATLRERLKKAELLNEDGEPTNLRRAAAFLNVSPSTLWRGLRKPPSRIPPDT